MLLTLIRPSKSASPCLAVILFVLVGLHFLRIGPAHSLEHLSSLQLRKESQETAHDNEFPRQIWQAFGLAGDGDGSGLEKWTDKINTWKVNNPEWEYTLLTNESATYFVESSFRHRQAIVEFWHNLRPSILRADFIRYLAILARGGIYSDVDTSCLVPISDFIPLSMLSKRINAVVGIEYDDTTYPLFVRPIAFTQWTLMAKPNHPIFETAVKRFMSNMEYLARLKGQELGSMETNKKDVLQGTGPGMFTDAVMEVLRDQSQQYIDWSTFHDQREPKLFGDVLVLPINGFASGQKHSHSSDHAYGTALVRHHFGKSWYEHD